MSEPEPWNVKYLSYQKGFIQDRHNGLASTLDMLFHYYIKDPKIRKDVGNNINRKIQTLYKKKIIGDDLYHDLDYTRHARNEFVKAIGAPDEVKIRGFLNKVKCIRWNESKRNKYSLYRLLFLCISQTHIELANCPTCMVIWNEELKDHPAIDKTTRGSTAQS